MKRAEKGSTGYIIHAVIGIAIMVLFFVIPHGNIMTRMGMDILGIFIGTLYLWSTVGSIWPSILAIVLVAIIGYGGEGSQGFNTVFSAAFGAETVLSVVFSLLFFAGISYLGFAKYISHFFLSRKIMEGRPYVFFASIMICSYIISGLTIPLTSMLLLFPVVAEMLKQLGYTKEDKGFYTLILAVYFSATLGQPMFPFKGAYLILYGVISKMFNVTIPYMNLIMFTVVMSVILMALYLLFVRVIIRPDLTKLKNLQVDAIASEKMDPFNKTQKLYLIIFIVYILAIMIPSFFSGSANIVWVTLRNMGTLGITIVAIMLVEGIHVDGKSIMPVKEVGKTFPWDMYFLVPVAVFLSGCLTNEELGITAFLKQALNPLFAGKSTVIFVFCVLLIALLLTQISSNVGSALLMFPIVAAFSGEYTSISPVVTCVLVSFIVFVAVLLPAASPYCSVLHTRRDLVSWKNIMKMYIPMIIVSVIAYVIIGFPLAKLIF